MSGALLFAVAFVLVPLVALAGMVAADLAVGLWRYFRGAGS